MKTNRSLIIPNVLVGVGLNIPGQLNSAQCKKPVLKSSFFCKEKAFSGPYATEDLTHAHRYRDEHYWPSWRTVKQVIDEVTVIEPAYYYRLETDYQLHHTDIPKPYIHTIDLSSPTYMASSRAFAQAQTLTDREVEVLNYLSYFDPSSNDNRAVDDIIQGILDADKNKNGVDTTRLVLEVKSLFSDKAGLNHQEANYASQLFSGQSVLVSKGDVFDIRKTIPIAAWAYDSLSDWKANDVGDGSSRTTTSTPTLDDDYFEPDPSTKKDEQKAEIRRQLVVAKYAYMPLPFVAQGHVPPHWVSKQEGFDPFGLCRTFLGNIPTNRSCFDKCK